jgi:hypothetical protein
VLAAFDDRRRRICGERNHERFNCDPLGIERAFPSAMVATDAVNLSVLWTDDRTALG